MIAINNFDDLFSVYFSIGNLLTTFVKKSLAEIQFFLKTLYNSLFSVYFSIGNLLTTFVKKSLAEIQFFLKTLYNSLAVVGAKIIWSIKLCPPGFKI